MTAGDDRAAAEPRDGAVPCPVCDGHGSLLRSGDGGVYFEACWGCGSAGRVTPAAVVRGRRLDG